jgi:hypothetical protein
VIKLRAGDSISEATRKFCSKHDLKTVQRPRIEQLIWDKHQELLKPPSSSKLIPSPVNLGRSASRRTQKNNIPEPESTKTQAASKNNIDKKAQKREEKKTAELNTKVINPNLLALVFLSCIILYGAWVVNGPIQKQREAFEINGSLYPIGHKERKETKASEETEIRARTRGKRSEEQEAEAQALAQSKAFAKAREDAEVEALARTKDSQEARAEAKPFINSQAQLDTRGEPNVIAETEVYASAHSHAETREAQPKAEQAKAEVDAQEELKEEVKTEVPW